MIAEDDDDIDDAEAWTELQLAASQGDIVLVSRLLKQGREPNEPPKGFYGRTALQAAAISGHLEVVNALIDSGSLIDAPGGNNGGRAALALAAGSGHEAVVLRLLQADANVNLQAHKYMGRTPLQAAGEGGNLAIVKLLLEKGADVNASYAHHFGRSALQAAASGGHTEIAERLLAEGGDINAPPSKYRGSTALQAAASSGNSDLVRKLINAGAEVNASAGYYIGATALAAAAEGGHLETVRVLLDAGADVSQRSGNHHHTPQEVADTHPSTNAPRPVIAAKLSPRESASAADMSDADFEKVRQAQAERNAASGKKGFKDSSSQRTNNNKISLAENFDKDLYDTSDKYAGYNTSIAADDDQDMEDADDGNDGRLVGQYTATAAQIGEWAQGDTAEDDILQSREKQAQIASRESEYQQKRFTARNLDGDGQKSYRETMQEREIEREEARVQRLIEEQNKEKIANGDDEMDGIEHHATLKDKTPEAEDRNGANGEAAAEKSRRRKRRWDDEESAPATNGDAETNGVNGHATNGDAEPKKSRWDATPAVNGEAAAAPKKRSKWDLVSSGDGGAAPQSNGASETPSAPVVAFGTDISSRNAPLSDEELDEMLPTEGYKILTPPPGYEPLRAPARRVAPSATPANTGGFMNQEPVDPRSMGKQLPSDIPGVGDLQFFKAEDMAYFGKLVDGADENDLSVEELKQRKIMRLLLKVKNGTPPMRKTALRQLTDNARSFGAGPLFDQILPLLMEKSLEDQERHLLVKVIDRVLYKLDDLVRPYVHKILVVIEPLLIDQDYYARVEGREIISNLAKAAGLATMISTMRPDIDHVDEYVRNTTARAFAVVASALGIPTLLPFLKAVCKSKKSWQARHTGVKIVQQIPILMGCAVLPHLKGLVDCIGENLNDEQAKVRTVTSLALAALAEASNPFGIESFDDILNPLWTGARKQRGKGLAGFLKAVGYIIPLMDEEYGNYYTSQIMEILLREFQSPDEEMKKVVLKVISQCAGGAGVTAQYLKDTVLNDFFKSFWVRRMALDKRNYKQVVETTVDLGHKVGVGEIVERIVGNLKDESEAYRKMTVETIEKVISAMGAADINERLEERLVDGILHSFQEQSVEDIVLLNGFGTVVNALGTRCKPYLPQIVSTILWRLNNKSATVRQQAADLITRIAIVLKQCDEDVLLGKLSSVLYEYLGEEYPEVLGSILGAMRSIVTVVGISSMQPPIKDLLPRLTPILRNRHEKVQENTIDLVGRIADRGPESVNAREWMRICFELLDMLKAHKKGIRRAANNTFGFIAKAIGPQDVLATLLNNLRVQERQSRVCTAVAIGIVAETCAPFTVLPALMNEYRVPELNVQNGVLKSLSFLFEYIGEMGKDYVYAVTPLLEDALIDRDQVHRQTAASVVKHIALGVVGLGCEDAMLHLLNLLYPNLFETSPHVIDRVIEAIDAIRLAVGTGAVMNYVWAGLFHPARKVRTPYWRLYNDAYVQSADAMVPYYPAFDDEKLKRHELMVVI
ncbi:hypothetical protein AC578_10286 [Pseudocercospora eumusae]|uniref:Uncharacterized protein n=1 Tax=Pseudocercospora eumusae TaxID=321146 RepID=A0A139HRM7_9PEZI|nr:hypothetical protein AC578_10286 [Pseudocercospora eumusae]